jgi:hypothetical protein
VFALLKNLDKHCVPATHTNMNTENDATTMPNVQLVHQTSELLRLKPPYVQPGIALYRNKAAEHSFLKNLLLPNNSLLPLLHNNGECVAASANVTIGMRRVENKRCSRQLHGKERTRTCATSLQ